MGMNYLTIAIIPPLLLVLCSSAVFQNYCKHASLHSCSHHKGVRITLIKPLNHSFTQLQPLRVLHNLVNRMGSVQSYPQLEWTG